MTQSAVFYRDFSKNLETVVRGSGAYLYTDNGRSYLDATSSAGVVAIGHGRVEITEALRDAGDQISFVYNGAFTHPWQESLARLILDVAPPGMSAVYFVSGGSEANETAMKLARQYFVEIGLPQKYKAITRWQSYHGVTLGCLSLSGRTSWRKLYSPYLNYVGRVQPPYTYRNQSGLSDDSFALQCADDLERTILLEGPETVAAFFAEPVVGSTVAGLTPPPQYYARIREICDKYNVLFIADEVFSGYGRTGVPFAIQHWDVTPDIISMGKGISSGYAPLGAMVASEKIVSVFRDGGKRFFHGLTFSGTPTSTFIGIKVHEIMRREGLFSRASELEPYVFGRLEALQQKHSLIGEVRGKGLLIGLELVEDRDTKRPFSEKLGVSASITAEAKKRGVLISAGSPQVNYGKDGDQILICPPLIITKDQIDLIVDTLDESITEVAQRLG
jgi:adenosylmethionine-8-amino-7-oxononanoate aminotransferase